ERERQVDVDHHLVLFALDRAAGAGAVEGCFGGRGPGGVDAVLGGQLVVELVEALLDVVGGELVGVLDGELGHRGLRRSVGARAGGEGGAGNDVMCARLRRRAPRPLPRRWPAPTHPISSNPIHAASPASPARVVERPRWVRATCKRSWLRSAV